MILAWSTWRSENDIASTLTERADPNISVGVFNSKMVRFDGSGSEFPEQDRDGGVTRSCFCFLSGLFTIF